MVRAASVLVLLLLLPLPASAQGDPAAPVQTVIDAVPTVVQQSIAEASFDLSPDDAQDTLDRMEAFVQDFLSLPDVPPGSDLAAIDAEQAYGFGVRVHALASRVPAAVAEVERTSAACASWAGNATTAEVEAWGRSLRANLFATVATAAGLVAEADATDLRVDTDPLRQAQDRLLAWESTHGLQALQCIQDLEIQHGIVPAGTLSLLAVPDRTWPGGPLVVLGAWSGAPGPVQIRSPTLDLDTTLHPEDRTFRLPVTVPLDAALGNASLHATRSDAEATATVRIDRIPARLHMDLPARVDPGATFPAAIRVATPVEGVPMEATVHFDGDLQGVHDLPGGAATIFLQAPSASTVLRGTLTYDGTDRIASAMAPYRIHAGTLAAPPADSGTEPSQNTPAPEVPGFPFAVAAIALLALAVVLVAIRFLPRARRRFQARRRDEAPALSLPARGLVAAFAAVVAWLVRRGWVRDSQTPREIAAWMGEHGVPVGPLVRDFERIRYGAHAEDPAKSRRAPGWLRQALRRLRRDAP